MPAITINHNSGSPSPPLNVMSVMVYGVSEYSLRVQWKPPRDDGGVPIDNYTLSLYSDHSILSQTATTDSLELTLTLNYSTNYSITITASNCAGSSSLSFNIAEGETKYFLCISSHLNPLPAGCSAPSSPVNGSIVEYWSTEEGAEIQFQCHDGYHPNQSTTSHCLNSTCPLILMT